MKKFLFSKYVHQVKQTQYEFDKYDLNARINCVCAIFMKRIWHAVK